ncbi:MAG: hypothetical protein HXX20_16175 [Chloroflexi bacterium]|nr:hypothetical protein [Chloroflexota bacterium]
MNELNLKKMNLTLELTPVSCEAGLQKGLERLLEEYLRLELRRKTALVAVSIMELLAPDKKRGSTKAKEKGPAEEESKTALALAEALEVLLQQSRQEGSLLELLRQATKKYEKKYKDELSETARVLKLLVRQLEVLEEKDFGLSYIEQLNNARDDLSQLGQEARRWAQAQNPPFERRRWEREYIENVSVELVRIARSGQEQ